MTPGSSLDAADDFHAPGRAAPNKGRPIRPAATLFVLGVMACSSNPSGPPGASSGADSGAPSATPDGSSGASADFLPHFDVPLCSDFVVDGANTMPQYTAAGAIDVAARVFGPYYAAHP